MEQAEQTEIAENPAASRVGLALAVLMLASALWTTRGGIGRELMDAAEQGLRHLGCPTINLQVRSTNDAVTGFYRALGFCVDEVISMGRRLEHD